MHHIRQTSQAFTILHQSLIGSCRYERIDETSVAVKIPDAGNIPTSFVVPYHKREKRPLVVLDGDVPTDGVSNQVRQLGSHSLGALDCSPYHERKPHEFELPVPRPALLTRHFLVIPQGGGIIIRYLPRTSARRYVFVTLRYLPETADTWQLTTQSTTF